MMSLIDPLIMKVVVEITVILAQDYNNKQIGLSK